MQSATINNKMHPLTTYFKKGFIVLRACVCLALYICVCVREFVYRLRCNDAEILHSTCRCCNYPDQQKT